MKYLVSGASGFIGSSLVDFLKEKGEEVLALVRSTPTKRGEIYWNPEEARLNLEEIEGVDVVVNLAGESIMGRWTKKKKALISQSRLESTQFLAESLVKLKKKPALFIGASAIGYYGDRGGELLDEASENGEGFLADLCIKWEQETALMIPEGIRVVNLRIGLVLSGKGGALKKMLLPFKLGLGGRIGSGSQFWSWITLKELLNMVDFIAHNPSISGPVNAVSSSPVTNREFTRILAKVLGRSAFLVIPEWLVKLIFGEMGEALLLGSQRVLPEKLIQNGYPFSDNQLESFLKKELP